MRGPKRTEIKGARRSTSKLIQRFAIRGISGFLVLLIFEYFVLPQIAGARKALHLVTQANYLLVLLGIVLEGFALFAYAKLTQVMLPTPRPKLWTLLRIDLASLSVSHVVPGGTASGSGMALKLMTNAGIRGTDGAFAIATQGIGSAVVLNVILWSSLIVSIPLVGFNSLYLIVAGLGLVLLAIIFALVLLFTKGQERAVLIADSLTHRIPLLRRIDLKDSIHRISKRLIDLGSDPKLLRNGVTWAAINWLADAGCLWVMLAGFGKWVNPDSLLVAYSIANVLAVLPLTPAGLGVIEAFSTLVLVKFFGVPRGIAILGVIAWRLFNFWLPIPVGVVSYISLKISAGVPPEDVTMELDRLDLDNPPT